MAVSHKTNICVSHINVRSLTVDDEYGKRTDHIKEFICKPFNCDLVACTETKLDKNVDDSDVQIEGYTLLRKDRTRFGGGVGMYLKEDLNYIRLTNLENENIELFWVKITWPNFSLICGVCYRPPGQTRDVREGFLTNLETNIHQLGTYTCDSIILLGDFNDPCYLWEANHFCSDLKNNLVTLSNSLDLTQLVKEPTRGNVILDLMFTNTPNLFSSVKILDPIHELDHLAIIGELLIKVVVKNKFKRHVWHYDKGNYELMSELIRKEPWESILSNCVDVDEMVNLFSNQLEKICSENIPNFWVQINPRDKQGMTGEVKRLFRLSGKLNRRAKKSLLQSDLEKYVAARNNAKNVWRKTQYLHYLKINDKMMSCDTTPKMWWKIARAQLGLGKAKSIPCIRLNGSFVSNDKEKCCALNDYFVLEASLDLTSECRSPMFQHVTSLDLGDLNSGLENDPLCDFEIHPYEVNKILKNIHIDKATGPDGINNRILKTCSDQLSIPLAIIFNKCIQTETFPTQWKYANFCPIFKTGDSQIISNYRPISLLSLVSKIFEKILYNRMYNYCVQNNILTARNSGFKKMDSAINQLIHLSHLIYKGLDDEMKIGMIFMDITKAFDKIWHKGLIYKLFRIGFRGKLLNLLSSYLSERFQRVVLNGSFSDFRKIVSGVPQGSLLGPLLFLCYLNDIVDDIKCLVSLFAGDTTLISIAKNWTLVESELQLAISSLEQWAKNWLIEFNPLKTFYMIITNRQNNKFNLNLQINNFEIGQVNSHKHLGIVLNNNFTWGDHVDYVCKKVSKKIGLLYKNRKNFSRLILVKLFNTTVVPTIEYGSVLYDSMSMSQSCKIEKLLRRGALICTGAIARTETSKLLSDLGWQSLKLRRLKAKLLLLFKVVNNIAPAYLVEDFCSIQINISKRLTRSSLNFEIKPPFCRTCKYKLSFFPSSIKAWNSLSPLVRIQDSVGKFKKYLNSKFVVDQVFFNYNLFSEPYSKILTQFRLGLSSLQGELFTYNLVDNPFCKFCLDKIESIEHFLLDCPAFLVARNNYRDKLRLYIPNFDSLNGKILVDICVRGSVDLDPDSNFNILLCTTRYIKKSKRFLF